LKVLLLIDVAPALAVQGSADLAIARAGRKVKHPPCPTASHWQGSPPFGCRHALAGPFIQGLSAVDIYAQDLVEHNQGESGRGGRSREAGLERASK
jgi:hypothetical protein